MRDQWPSTCTVRLAHAPAGAPGSRHPVEPMAALQDDDTRPPAGRPRFPVPWPAARVGSASSDLHAARQRSPGSARAAGDVRWHTAASAAHRPARTHIAPGGARVGAIGAAPDPPWHRAFAQCLARRSPLTHAGFCIYIQPPRLVVNRCVQKGGASYMPGRTHVVPPRGALLGICRTDTCSRWGQADGLRRIRPDVSPLSLPQRTTGRPLTKTCSTPTAYWCGC